MSSDATEAEGPGDAGAKPPVDRLLDLFVFGPAGLAITAVEEFPRLAAKGRHRVEGQVHTARLVGQFVVQMGRRQVGQVVDRFTRPIERPAPVQVRPASPAHSEPSSASNGDGALQPARAADHAATDGNGSGPVSALAIPGYDSLSASQVVQRLDGLSRDELDDVRSHELAHRHRRTILHRIEQLLAGPDGDQP
ncbi:MAG TPA: hypothetical protein VKU86_13840 [Acidimicrobiales bacterium]|nr:hypothetical protein [Acidimicrobiales bacterium]